FSTMRVAAIQAAKDLFGDDSNEAKSVNKAYDAVGVQ
ncbi:M4 family metallopeptidase, partial [Paenibacillus larvae]